MPELSLPATFGRYTLLECVGGGGMAQVYRAALTGEGGFEKELAVKVVRPELATEPQFVEMFLDEARLSARLSHANLVHTFDFGQVDGTWFLAMEFVRGPTLAKLLRICRTRGVRLGAARAVHVAGEVARGLGFAHRLCDEAGAPLGLVHRDVSPQNVLLSREGEVKLADFGIAKAAWRSTVTKTGHVRGKIAYMAPEQARGETLDARTDVFALGVVLWESITGQALFDGSSDGAVLLQVMQREIPPPSRFCDGVPPALDDLVLRMLARERRLRPANGDEVAREIAALKLRLVRSPDEIDLAAFLRQLSSGTAVLGAVGQGGAAAPVGETGEAVSAEIVESSSGVWVDPAAETLVRGRPGATAAGRLPGGEASPPAPPGDATRPAAVRGLASGGAPEAETTAPLVPPEDGGAPRSRATSSGASASSPRTAGEAPGAVVREAPGGARETPGDAARDVVGAATPGGSARFGRMVAAGFAAVVLLGTGWWLAESRRMIDEVAVPPLAPESPSAIAAPGGVGLDAARVAEAAPSASIPRGTEATVTPERRGQPAAAATSRDAAQAGGAGQGGAPLATTALAGGGSDTEPPATAVQVETAAGGSAREGGAVGAVVDAAARLVATATDAGSAPRSGAGIRQQAVPARNDGGAAGSEPRTGASVQPLAVAAAEPGATPRSDARPAATTRQLTAPTRQVERRAAPAADESAAAPAALVLTNGLGAGTTATLDGRPLGELPPNRPLRLESTAGSHELVFRPGGAGHPCRVRIVLEPGSRTAVMLGMDGVFRLDGTAKTPLACTR